MSREQFEKWCEINGHDPSWKYAEEVYPIWQDAWQAAQAAAVPEGWQVVPKESTPEICDALACTGRFGLKKTWELALAAAPKPEDVKNGN